MRGSIRPGKTKGTYVIILSTGKDPVTKKYGQKWITVRGTKADAETRLAEEIRLRDTGFTGKPGKVTLGEYLQRWLREYAKPNLSPRTYEGYESIINVHIIKALGRLQFSQLKPEHIQKYYADKLQNGRYDGKGGLNSSTVRHHAMCLHTALDTAVKWRLIPYNPADAVDPPPMNNPEMHTLNENEVNLLLESARSTPYYPIFATAIYTGMRRSELLALKWADIDLLGMTISVNKSLHKLHDKSIIFRQPKTAKGKRNIALSPAAVAILKEYKEQCIAQKLIRLTTLKENDLVFAHEDGTPLDPDVVTHNWIRLCRKIDLKNIRLHDARHTHASLMLKQGIHPKIVQERLGHASIQITLDIYSHVSPGLQEAAAQRFDDILNGRKDNAITPVN